MYDEVLGSALTAPSSRHGTSSRGIFDEAKYGNSPNDGESNIIVDQRGSAEVLQHRVSSRPIASTRSLTHSSPKGVSKQPAIPQRCDVRGMPKIDLQPQLRPRSSRISTRSQRPCQPESLMLSSQAVAVAARPVLRARPLILPRQDGLGPERPVTVAHRMLGHHPSQPPPIAAKKFVLGIDLGVTFTTIAYATHNLDQKTSRLAPEEVKYITNWADDGNAGSRAQVPSELWFAPALDIPQTPVNDSETNASESEMELDNPSRISHGANCLRNIRAAGTNSAIFHHATTSKSNTGWSPTNEEVPEHLWGYSVHHQKYSSSTDRDIMGYIDRPKLMLVEASHTEDDRARLSPRLEHLIGNGTIGSHGGGPEDILDVLTFYLVKVLGHTKTQLMEREGYTSNSPVSFALTVPTIWSARSSRILQTAFQAAIRLTDFSTLVNGSLENVFIVTEPEAAATFLLGYTHQMLPGETFAVLDCGGGTVDGSTYTVTSTYPLRLKSEIGQPSGDNCGASYLNDFFEKRILERLSDETYLGQNGETREDLVRNAVPDFENRGKRKIDLARRPLGEVRIPGLRGDSTRKVHGLGPKNFKPGYVNTNKEDFNEIFISLLERSAVVLSKQLDGALQQGIDLKKVFLIGGFGANPSLRGFLKTYLDNFTKALNLNYDIELHVTNEQDSVTAIAAGATIRALNLNDGPKRQAVSSFGFLRREPHVPNSECHLNADITIDPFDHLEYVCVIDYFLHKGEIIPPRRRYQPFKSTHSFDVDEERFLCD